MADLSITLTDKERQMLLRVLEDHEYQVKGKSLVFFGKLLEGLLAKLEVTDASESP